MAINIGFIGAGGIARERHLPNLARIGEGRVKVAAVANRSRESGEKIAKEFGISEVMEDWRALIARQDLDAVFIGTWPYMHKEMSIAALEAGKHVFCQARMAMDLAEAKAMVAAAQKHAKQVVMVCPPPHRMPYEPFIRKVIGRGAGGELGAITAVEVYSVGGGNLNRNAITWRERREFSGNQIMAVGIFAETLNAWVGPYEELSARLATPIATKTDGATRKTVNIDIPQVVTVNGKLANGAIAYEHHSGVATDRSSVGSRITIWGLNGTLRVRYGAGAGGGDVLEMAKGGQALAPVDVPENLKRDWHVEEDFVAAVENARAGKAWKLSPDFEEALLYMQKMEAIHLSAGSGKGVRLTEL